MFVTQNRQITRKILRLRASRYAQDDTLWEDSQLLTANRSLLTRLNIPFPDFTQILHILVFLYMDLPTILHIIGIEKLYGKAG